MKLRTKCNGDLLNVQEWRKTDVSVDQMLLAVIFISMAYRCSCDKPLPDWACERLRFGRCSGNIKPNGAWEGVLVAAFWSDVTTATEVVLG